MEATEREIFLTARFRLYSLLGKRLIAANVEHKPWPLESARLVRCEQNLTLRAGLPETSDPPLVHFSPGVEVRIGGPTLVHRATVRSELPERVAR